MKKRDPSKPTKARLKAIEQLKRKFKRIQNSAQYHEERAAFYKKALAEIEPSAETAGIKDLIAEEAIRSQYMLGRQRIICGRNTDLRLIYLMSHPCVDCGFADPRALEFDHLKELGGKITELSKLDRASIGRWLDEAARCDIRCCNCHKLKTLSECTDNLYKNASKFVKSELANHLETNGHSPPNTKSPGISLIGMLQSAIASRKGASGHA